MRCGASAGADVSVRQCIRAGGPCIRVTTAAPTLDSRCSAWPRCAHGAAGDGQVTRWGVGARSDGTNTRNLSTKINIKIKVKLKRTMKLKKRMKRQGWGGGDYGTSALTNARIRA